MIYAILAYHEEGIVAGWSADEDAVLMDDLHKVHRRLTDEGKLGPAARLALTGEAVTVRTRDKPLVIDGPFAETKEQLLGFYILECADRDEAVAAVFDLARANPTAVYEIRPVMLMLKGAPMPGAEELPPA
jgi:hypothetical protein